MDLSPTQARILDAVARGHGTIREIRQDLERNAMRPQLYRLIEMTDELAEMGLLGVDGEVYVSTPEGDRGWAEEPPPEHEPGPLEVRYLQSGGVELVTHGPVRLTPGEVMHLAATMRAHARGVGR